MSRIMATSIVAQASHVIAATNHLRFLSQLLAGVGDRAGVDDVGVAAVGPHSRRPRTAWASGGQQCPPAGAVLQAGGCHRDRRHQAEGVDQQVPLAAADPLAGVVADRRPPSCVFTDRASSTRSRVPSALQVRNQR
jgi:hypothetical protein